MFKPFNFYYIKIEIPGPNGKLNTNQIINNSVHPINKEIE